MSRPTLVALAIGILGVAALVVARIAGGAVMPSYLGAWLFLLALPLGALPIVMGAELFDLPETALLVALRRLLVVMPLAAILAVPVLLRLPGLYPWLAVAKSGLPGWWMTPGFFVLRAIVFLVAWTALCLAFARPAAEDMRRRATLAGFGLGLHLVMGTLAADDWVQAAEPSFNSSAFGLLVIAAQCSIAVSLALAMAVTGREPGAAARSLSADRRDLVGTQQVATGLAVLLASWGFLVFTQYLVVWSANLPKEVIWYQHRAAGIGLAAEYAAGILCVLALLLLLPRGPARHVGIVAWVAAALVVMHAVEMLWFVTPAFRFAFTITAADLFALAAAAGLGIGLVLLIGERFDRERVGHGRA